ncbi:MAG TPA: GTP cyclohydrolase II [Candidatus Acidoferrales bacterium]|nr:GTP cyclohydrolase II [Candidatus Acidoferrales bacterium]
MARKHKKAKPRIVAKAQLPTRYGRFAILAVQGATADESAVVLLHGKISRGVIPLVRIHSQCLTGDVFHSERCDCRAQLELAQRKTARARCGLVIYLPQEGRGIGLMNKLKAYELQDRGMDTVEANRELGFAADDRDYRFCAATLKLLGARAIRLLSNNPDKVQQLEQEGIRIVERIPCQPRTSRRTRSYLVTKKNKLGHLLELS